MLLQFIAKSKYSIMGRIINNQILRVMAVLYFLEVKAILGPTPSMPPSSGQILT
jgi:hypothetical protein